MKKNRVLFTLVAVVAIFSMLLSACGTKSAANRGSQIY